MIDYKTSEGVAQDSAEFARFIEIIKAEDCRSFLEVGSKYGGALWLAANALPKGSRIVSIDMPGGTKAWRDSERSLKACIAELRSIGYDAHVIWGDSTAPSVIDQAQRLGPYDCVFLDGNHTRPFVETDTRNYAPMADKLMAYHDIGWKRAPTWVGTRIDVPEFWEEHKHKALKFEDIKLCPTGKNNGIGVLWV